MDQVSKEDLVPPQELLPPYARRGDFIQAGEEFLTACVERAGLKPSDRVLDVGCGVGRFAVALAGYMSDQGSYEGIDVSARAIRVAREWITPKFPELRFQRVAAYNGMYNAQEKAREESYRFPFADASFDFVFSNSLFTHLLPDATFHYIQEIARVLRPGGRTLNSMFLLNGEAKRLIDTGACPVALPNNMGVYRTKDAALPEAFVAYEENFMLGLHRGPDWTSSAPFDMGCGVVGLRRNPALVARISLSAPRHQGRRAVSTS
jgi:SAM-dependent methyltransferase